MLMPNVYGYGTIFGFSGIDGENRHNGDFVGMTMDEPVTIRFDGEKTVTLRARAEGTPKCVVGDLIEFGDVLIVFLDCDTVTGRAEEVTAEGEDPEREYVSDGVKIIESNGFFYALCRDGDRFVFARKETEEDAVREAKTKLSVDPIDRRDAILKYYENLPKCTKPEYERLYYKCMSVNRVNVYSPQDGFDCRFTTPDRLPHRHMWLWDSMFHAMAISKYNPALAREAIRAVLCCQRDDGFIPHMMKSRTDISSITQPQVIAYAALEVYKSAPDTEFLSYCAERIEKYLLWFVENRDDNSNGLFEWKTDFSNTRCRCDESGMDNSPRFDTTKKLDAIDCSCFMANDCRCLSEIFAVLGDEEKSRRFKALSDETAKNINEYLWDESAGAYCDRSLDGDLTGVLTCSSFLPMFAGICPPDRARRLAALLEDEGKFASPLPVPSVARDDASYGADMWRGCVWLNYNYFIYCGLKNCGFDSLAETIKKRTLDAVNEIYLKTGRVYEFYDPELKLDPMRLNRKGEQPEKPDYRVKMHSITDYNWSASFIILAISD